MINKLILEEINRFKLLYGYNSKKTLTENQLELDEVLGGALKGVTMSSREVGGEIKSFFGSVENLIKDFKLTNIKKPERVQKLLGKDLEGLESELVKAIQKDLEIGYAPINDTRSAAKDISKIIAMRRIIDEQAKLAQEWLAAVNKQNNATWASVEEASGGLKQLGKPVEIPKVSAETIKVITNDVKSSALQRVGEVKPKTPKTPKTGEGGGGSKPTEGVKATESSTNIEIKIDTEIENNIQQIIKKLEQTEGRGAWKWTSGKWTWGNVWPYLAAAGTGAAIWGLLSWLFSKNGVQYFPQCIGGKVLLNPQGLEKTAKEGLPTNMVYMMDPANPKLNGALFISDGKNSKTGQVRLPNGTSGNYIHTGDQVEIKAGGDVFNMDCSQTLIVQGGSGEETTPKPKPSGGCTPSSNFPFEYYQRNSMVGEVQNCVGAAFDNCMGPQTARKIQQFLGLSETPTSLTKDIYDKVIAKCGGKKSSSEDKPIREPNQISGGVTGGGEKPSSEEDFEF